MRLAGPTIHCLSSLCVELATYKAILQATRREVVYSNSVIAYCNRAVMLSTGTAAMRPAIWHIISKHGSIFTLRAKHCPQPGVLHRHVTCKRLTWCAKGDCTPCLCVLSKHTASQRIQHSTPLHRITSHHGWHNSQQTGHQKQVTDNTTQHVRSYSFVGRLGSWGHHT
jgi:hypothetical protein